MASEPQVNYITSLASKRDLTSLTDEQRAQLKTNDYLLTLKNDEVGQWLELLKSLPWLNSGPNYDKYQTKEQHTPVGVANEVDKGRYFIIDPTDNVEKFIKVDKPAPPSKWAGYTFVSVQASEDFYAIRNKKHRDAVLTEIAKDPINAMNEYGIRLGVCGMCGRTLTQRDSRLRGMGPICAAKVDSVPTEDDLNILSELGLI